MKTVLVAAIFGVTATFSTISELYYWRGMYDAVLGEVNSCQECQRHNTIKKGPYQFHHVPVPDAYFARRGMNRVGPVNCSPSGNQYIVVFTEYLSRWSEAKPLPNKSAMGVCGALAECVVSRFGCPETIIRVGSL